MPGKFRNLMSSKKVDEINLDTIDLDKHKITIPAGTKLYRICRKGANPLKPTGKASRFAKEPPSYTFEKYQAALENGKAISIGTGANYFCVSLPTAIQEVGGDTKDKEVYMITLKLDIEIIDMNSICKAEGISKPYITEERAGIWHKFYGKKVNGLRYESSKNPADYNVVIFPDWFKEFKNIVVVEKCERNST